MRYQRFFFMFAFLLMTAVVFAQQADTASGRKDTTVRKRDTATRRMHKADTPAAQNPVTPRAIPTTADKTPTSLPEPIDTATGDTATAPTIAAKIPTRNTIDKVISLNKYLNVKAEPQYFANEIRTWKNGKELFFYIMCGLLLILGMFKTFYRHYFSTLFTVYFNTSLRQTQLSEQLLQAKLPSFILNIFFVLMAGIFAWLLFLHSYSVPPQSPYVLLEICMIAIAAIYLFKFCFLKFLGWMSGISDVTNHYIFIIFLVNKLLAIILIPFVVLLAFGRQEWASIYITSGLLCIGALLLSRYIKSYGLLRQKFPMTAFHFLLFFVGAELLPLLVMYKIATDYLVH